jgi:hypothetical protein
VPRSTRIVQTGEDRGTPTYGKEDKHYRGGKKGLKKKGRRRAARGPAKSRSALAILMGRG